VEMRDGRERGERGERGRGGEEEKRREEERSSDLQGVLVLHARSEHGTSPLFLGCSHHGIRALFNFGTCGLTSGRNH